MLLSYYDADTWLLLSLACGKEQGLGTSWCTIEELCWVLHPRSLPHPQQLCWALPAPLLLAPCLQKQATVLRSRQLQTHTSVTFNWQAFF